MVSIRSPRSTLTIVGNKQPLADLDLRAPKTLTTLMITNSNLSGELDLSGYPNLVTVDLTNNKLATLTGLAASATSLKNVSCVNNKLEKLPEGLEQLTGCTIDLTEAFEDNTAGANAVNAVNAFRQQQSAPAIKFDVPKAASIAVPSNRSTAGGIGKSSLLNNDAKASWKGRRQGVDQPAAGGAGRKDQAWTCAILSNEGKDDDGKAHIGRAHGKTQQQCAVGPACRRKDPAAGASRAGNAAP